MRTSVVGSFPLEYSESNVERVMLDLWRIGVDAPTYPQLRSFIDIYMEPLVKAGIVDRKGNFYFSSPERISEAKFPAPAIDEAEIATRIVREEKLGFKWLRAPVTGPLTLASRIYVRPETALGLNATLLAHKELVKEVLAKYIREYVKYLVNMGFNIVFLDEPVLGVIVGRKRILLGYTETELSDIISSVIEQPGIEKGVHVCGRVSNKLFTLLASTKGIDFRNLELHDTPQNIDVINGSLLEKNDKKLSPGVISSKKPIVEDENEIETLLRRISERAKGRMDLVSPDCGFGGLREAGESINVYSIVLKKLERLTSVVRRLEKELTS